MPNAPPTRESETSWQASYGLDSVHDTRAAGLAHSHMPRPSPLKAHVPGWNSRCRAHAHAQAHAHTSPICSVRSFLVVNNKKDGSFPPRLVRALSPSPASSVHLRLVSRRLTHPPLPPKQDNRESVSLASWGSFFLSPEEPPLLSRQHLPAATRHAAATAFHQQWPTRLRSRPRSAGPRPSSTPRRMSSTSRPPSPGRPTSSAPSPPSVVSSSVTIPVTSTVSSAPRSSSMPSWARATRPSPRARPP